MTREEAKKTLAQHDLFGDEETLELAMQDLDDHLQCIPQEYRADAYLGAMELYNTALRLIEEAKTECMEGERYYEKTRSNRNS